MRIAIRVDASLHIGTGHLMRCLTLADVIRDAGGEVVFVCRGLADALGETIAARGHELRALPAGAEADPADHASWLGVAWEQDADETRTVLADSHFDWLLIDHYSIDARWHAALAGVAARIAVIDDLADRPHAADLLLDQNLHAHWTTRYRDRVPESCRVLIGPGYALLGSQFTAARAQATTLRAGSGS